MSKIRLQRYLAMGGAAARRKGEELIVAGRVQVNGVVVRELGTKVDPDADRVTVDGEAVYPQDHFYVVLNKPKGCITTVSDDQGRPTVMDYLPNLPAAVKPVGRLDFYSEGVLLLTNDGELASRLLSPTSHVAKTYHVKVRGVLGKRDLERLRAGVRLDDGTVTREAEVVPLPGESKHSWVAITLYEGKSRQIHRMLETCGFEVTKLQRVAFANLTFHGLRVGDARELRQDELNELRDAVGLPRGAGARGKWRAVREDSELGRRARHRARVEAEALGQPAPRSAPAVVRGARAPAPRDDPRETQRRRRAPGCQARRQGPSRRRRGAPSLATGQGRAVRPEAGVGVGPTRPSRGAPSRGAPARGRPSRSGGAEAGSPRGAAPGRGAGSSRGGPARGAGLTRSPGGRAVASSRGPGEARRPGAATEQRSRRRQARCLRRRPQGRPVALTLATAQR
ncbi:MAG: pseudouridine synthase [Kofleriaceae bacterium]